MNVRTFVSGLVSGLVSLGTFVGCAPPSAGTFGEDYEEALCEWATGCRAFEDVKQCRKALVWDSQARFSYMVDAIAAGRSRFDADAALRCLDAIEAQSCDEGTLTALLFSSGFQAAPAACEAVYAGKVGNYEPCMHSEECAGDAVCGFPPCDGACCEGSCRVIDAAPKLGEPCGGSCEDAAYCAQDPVTFQFTTCEKRLGVGGDCSFNTGACKAGLYCNFQDEGTYRCAELLAEGVDCSAGGICADGLTCYSWPAKVEGESWVYRCQAVPSLGDACSDNNYPACAGVDSTCDAASGTCLPLALPEEPCDARGCMPFAECNYSEDMPTCVARAGLGERCGIAPSYTSCIGHLQCNGERCEAPEPAPACDVPK